MKSVAEAKAEARRALEAKQKEVLLPYIPKNKIVEESVTIQVKKRREFMWSQVSKLIDFNILNKRTKEINLDNLIIEYPNVLKGAIAGRLIVNPNK